MKPEEEFRKIVNASGFLFQLRVENEIETTQLDHRWTVLAREHPWQDVASDRNGYIDLVLGKANVRLVIECKRTRDADWIFLVPKGEGSGSLIRGMGII